MNYYYSEVAAQALKNMGLLNIFISFSVFFLIYFVLLFICLIWDHKWCSAIGNRTIVMYLLLIKLIGSLYVAYNCFTLGISSLIGICTLLVIIAYLVYLYYYDPFGLALLPARLEKIYLFLVITFVFLGLVKMFFDLLGQAGAFYHAHQTLYLMEQLKDFQETGGVSQRKNSYCPHWRALTRGENHLWHPCNPRGLTGG